MVCTCGGGGEGGHSSSLFTTFTCAHSRGEGRGGTRKRFQDRSACRIDMRDSYVALSALATGDQV